MDKKQIIVIVLSFIIGVILASALLSWIWWLSDLQKQTIANTNNITQIINFLNSQVKTNVVK